jgi:hypothetical protein
MTSPSPSLQALGHAIEALAAEQERITWRIEQGADDADDLADEVLDMQKALSELGGLYESQRATDQAYPPLNTLLAQGKARAGRSP